MQVQSSLIAELEDAIRTGSRDKRVDILRRTTDLFLGGVNRLNDEQIGVFDDVLGHLVERIESEALRELSERLASVDKAPPDVIRRLAYHDKIAVAGPVLTRSSRLATSELIEIAKTKSQAHLLAISGRAQIAESVTDVLIDRGDKEVVRTLVSNSGARFSESGYVALSERAESDANLGEGLIRRLDVPLELFRALLLRATEAVRSRLLSTATPERQAEIHLVLANVADRVGRRAGRDYKAAHETATLMHREGLLNEAALLQFAISGRFEQVVASMALLCSVPLELLDRLMHGDRIDALLLPCKAARLDWSTVRAILKLRCVDRPASDYELDKAKTEYAKLTIATAQRVMRFWQVRETAGSARAPAA